MEEPLRVPQQYQRRLGRELRVVGNDGKEVKGILQQVLPDGIELKEIITRKENKKKVISEAMHTIPFAEIKEAKLIINYKFK
jgi:ribosome maturation factor RimP